MNTEDPSKINELNKSLYSRNAPDIRTKRRLRFYEQDVNVKSDWDHPAEPIDPDVDTNREYKDTSMSFFTKIFLGSFIFFILALGIGAFLVFNGSNTVSANNVDISINGPVSVAGGEPVSFEIQVSNNNNIKLETVDLSINFPAGTVDAADGLRELKAFKELIPDINPGGVGKKTINAILYGEENVKKEIKVSIEYRVKGSNAVFLKEKTFDVLISSSPLTLSVSSFKEVNSSQEFELAVTLNSNSKEVIKDLLLKAVYPFGFTYTSSDVKPSADMNTWKIGDIPPGGKKIVKIKGKLEGQDDEVRVFRFTTGVARLGSDKFIGTEYTNSSQEVSIKKPFMTVDVALNGESSDKDFITKFNTPVRVDISYFNNLPTSVIDAEVNVKIAGSAFDKTSVLSDEGLFRAPTSEIVWNGITTKSLSTIDAGGSGKVSFTITPRDLGAATKSITNANLKFIVSIKGKRNSETNVPETIVSTATKGVKISSAIAFGGQVIRSGSPFMNTGLIPPHADQPTTYTVVWTVDNTSNNVSDTQVQSSLPPYVKWLGSFDPKSEDISYDSVSGQIIWNAGSLGTYTAGSNRRKQVSFQVELTPSITQLGTAPVLINQAYLIATDDFTGETLKSNLGVLNTRFSTDASFRDGDEKVSQ